MKIVWTRYFFRDGNFVEIVPEHADMAPGFDMRDVVSVAERIEMTREEFEEEQRRRNERI